MIKSYEAIFDENLEGVFAISLVESPAMEGNFIALNKQPKIEFKEVDKEQRILMGLVLEPNKPIYRNDNGEEYNIVFSSQTIKDLSYNFFKSNHQSNSTIEHDVNQRIEGVTFVESWIVEDTEKDKSALYGFSYPKGSWLATMKVDSDDVWNDYVKSGKVQGFSIDAILSLKEINFKSEINMSNQIVDAISKGFQMVFNKKEAEVEVKLGSVKSKDGEIVFEFDGEIPQAGASGWITGEDGTKIPLPIGEHETEDGKVIVVTEEGLIAEVKDAMVDEPTPEAMQTETPQSGVSEAQASEIANAVKSVLIKYSEEMNIKFSELQKANEELKAEVLELSKQPAAKTPKSVPTQSGTKLTLTQRLNNKL